MPGFNADSFPSAILVKLGTAFGPDSNFWGLGANDYVVLKRASLTATKAIYTESGLTTFEEIVGDPPQYPIEPENRLRLDFEYDIGNVLYKDTIYGSKVRSPPVRWVWDTLDEAEGDAVDLGGWPRGGTLTDEMTTDSIDATGLSDYTLLDVFTAKAQAGDIYNSACIAIVSRYYPTIALTADARGHTPTITPATPQVGDSVAIYAFPTHPFRYWMVDGEFLSSDNPHAFTLPFVEYGVTYAIHAYYHERRSLAIPAGRGLRLR